MLKFICHPTLTTIQIDTHVCICLFFLLDIFINTLSLRGRLNLPLQGGKLRWVDLHTRHVEPEFISVDTQSNAMSARHMHIY